MGLGLSVWDGMARIPQLGERTTCRQWRGPWNRKAESPHPQDLVRAGQRLGPKGQG